MNKSFQDNSVWGKSPYVFKMTNDFTTMQEVLSMLLGSGEYSEGNKRADYHSLITDGMPADFLTRPSQSDTSVGGCDVINPYWQFNDDDDIIHPITAINGTPSNGGMGRVYSETVDTPQQVLYMTMGVPQFGNLTAFYSSMMEKNLADFVNTGETSVATLIGKFVGELVGGAAVIRFAFSIPYLPFVYIAKKISDLVDQYKVTKYYDFKSTMPMYYRYVNTIITHLAVNMGLFPDGDGKSTNGQFNEKYVDLYSNANAGAIPDVFSKGISIFRILSKRDQRLRPSGQIPNDEDYLTGEIKDDNSGWFSTFTHRLSSSMLGADRFIGFRVEKSTDSSESISNQSGESTLAQTINSTAGQAKDKWFSLANGNVTDMGMVSAAIKGVADMVSGLLNSVGVVNSATTILTGSGYADIPEIWQNSSFSKSYSFKMTLRAPAADPLSIMQSIYIPLACLLAAALPRSVGTNSYTSPFLIRAYCKGMFAIPMGIIDSFSITRGASEFGWSYGKLPTVVDVSFTIKDLSPAMHMAMADQGFLGILAQNSSFQEYLLTLSGIGLSERLLWFENVKRKWKTAYESKRTRYFSPLWWATTLGNSVPARLVGMINPWTRFQQN